MTNYVNHFLFGKKMLNYDLNIAVTLTKLIKFKSILSIFFDKNQLEAMNGIHPSIIIDSIIIKVIEKFRY